MNNSTTPSPFTDNFTANADEFYSQLYVSVPIGVLLIFIYCMIRRLCINQFEYRRGASQYLLLPNNDNNNSNDNERNQQQSIKYPQLSSTSLFHWIYDIWMMNSNTFYMYAGFDALVFRLFITACFKICLLSLPYSLFILLPIYATSGSNDTDDWLDKLSLNTIPAENNRLYATVVASYLFSFIALYYLSNIYLQVAYVTDNFYVDTKKENLKNIDQISWFNYNKTLINDDNKSKASMSINDLSDIDLNNDDDEEKEEKQKLSIDFGQDLGVPPIDRYTVMIRNLPKHLQNEESFTQLMHHLYGKDKILKVVIAPDVSNLSEIDQKIKFHETKLKQLSKKHNFKLQDVYNESDPPEIYGRLHCFGCCGKSVNLVLYHRQNKDELTSKLNRLKTQHRISLTSTGFVVFKKLEDASCFVSAPKSYDLLMMDINKAPPPSIINWENLKFTSSNLFTTNLFIIILMTFLLIFWSIPVIGIQGLANLEELFDTFGGDIHDYLTNPTIAYLQGSLTVLILDLWLSSIPLISDLLSKLQKPIDRRQSELLIISKYYLCLIFMVLLVTVITSTILNGANNYEDYFKNFVDNIGNIANLLANGLSNMSIYFLLYILLNTFIWLPLELFRFGYHISNKFSDDKSEINHFFYSAWIPKILLIFTICLTYSVMNPILNIFGLIYFLFAIIIFTYNLSMNYIQIFQIGPKLWQIIFDLIRYSFVISIVTLYGLLLLKQSYICSFLELLLLIIVWIFTGKIKEKFDKIFKSSSLISAKSKDMMLKHSNLSLKVTSSTYLPSVISQNHQERQPYYQLQQ